MVALAAAIALPETVGRWQRVSTKQSDCVSDVQRDSGDAGAARVDATAADLRAGAEWCAKYAMRGRGGAENHCQHGVGLPGKGAGRRLPEFAAVYDDIVEHYTQRLSGLNKTKQQNDELSNKQMARYRALIGELLKMERKTAVGLRNDGRINNEVFRRIEREFDVTRPGWS